MSDSSEPKPNLDLSQLRLMPQWVADFGKTASSPAADYPEERPRDRGDRRGGFDGGRDQRRSFGGGGGGAGGAGRSGGPPRGDRKPFDKPHGPSTGGPDRGPRPQGDRRDDRRGGGGNFRQDRDRDRQHGRGGRDDRGGGRPAYEQAPAPVAGLTVVVEPEAKATEAMATMIRTAGKAYSVFDAARLVLASGDRFHVKFKLAPDASAKLYAVPTDGSLWLSREDALSHVLHGEAISNFYRVDEIELEAPKGNFNSVAVCGMSGEMLGPPSHHSYQSTLHKLHRERFSHLHFEDYKRRVRTDSTPEAVEKWKESQKHGTQWTYLKGEVAEGEEPKTFKSRAEMETHFRATHAESLVGEVTDATVSGNIPKRLLAPSLYNHLRRAVDDARKHLLATAQMLCSGFERVGLKLFKRRGGKLWVSRTRPRLLESSVVLSDRISRMVEVIKTQPGIQVKKLIETVAPSPEGATTSPPAKAEKSAQPAPVAETAPVPPPVEIPEEPTDSTPVDTTTDKASAPAAEVLPVSEEAAATESAAETTAPEPTPTPAPPAATLPAAAPTPQHEWTAEQLHALQDLHWLNSEGYVIEYADGIVFPGVTEPPPPKPKAELPPKAKPESKKDAAAADAPASDEAAPQEEGSASPESAEASPTNDSEESMTESADAPASEEASSEVTAEAPAADEQVPVDEAVSHDLSESADDAAESAEPAPVSGDAPEEVKDEAEAPPTSEETSPKAE